MLDIMLKCVMVFADETQITFYLIRRGLFILVIENIGVFKIFLQAITHI